MVDTIFVSSFSFMSVADLKIDARSFENFTMDHATYLASDHEYNFYLDHLNLACRTLSLESLELWRENNMDLSFKTESETAPSNISLMCAAISELNNGDTKYSLKDIEAKYCNINKSKEVQYVVSKLELFTIS